MLGRVRACSLSSLEVLEMERTPSKLLKDDSLSIYEKTLLKLQQGSQRDVNSFPDESMNTDTSPSMATNLTNEASVAVNDSSQSMITSIEEQHGKLSVLDMFSRYKSSRNDNKSSTTMAMEDESSPSKSPSNDSELLHGCIVDPPSPI